MKSYVHICTYKKFSNYKIIPAEQLCDVFILLIKNSQLYLITTLDLFIRRKVPPLQYRGHEIYPFFRTEMVPCE